MERVILGLSGGVDSAVAAWLLKEQGYEVHGVYLDIGLDGAEAARRCASELEIDLHMVDIRRRIEERVCRPFAEGYLAGKTPSPCVLCNPQVKFPALLDMADRLGARFAATGHYARCRDGRLFMGRPANDQSYMLSRLTGAQLRRCLFPLGEMEKTEVRALALRLGLSPAQKPDSMEICFIPDGDYAAFIEARGETPPPGAFVDRNGNVLGTHRGIHHYTIGQRRGLGIALGRRMFVSAIDPERNTVTLSDGSLKAGSLRAGAANWLFSPPEAGFECRMRVRHSRVSVPAFVTPEGDGFTAVFPEPVRAPTPGQAAVGYVDGEVVCSGWIL